MNVFEGGGLGLHLSNGGTEVFIEVLVLAVSDLAEDPWAHRFAALLNLQDQNMMGRGVVGFDLEDIDWGTTPQERGRSRDFVLRVTDLALSGHRRQELGYDPPFAQEYLRRFRAMVETFVPGDRPRDPRVFPARHEAAMACCVQHRVLNGLPHWPECVFCTR